MEQVIQFKTCDGKIFDDPETAQYHEARVIKINAILGLFSESDMKPQALEDMKDFLYRTTRNDDNLGRLEKIIIKETS